MQSDWNQATFGRTSSSQKCKAYVNVSLNFSLTSVCLNKVLI